MFVTVGEVEACKFFSQLMLGCGNHVQGRMKFSMAGSLKRIMSKSGFNNNIKLQKQHLQQTPILTILLNRSHLRQEHRAEIM